MAAKKSQQQKRVKYTIFMSTIKNSHFLALRKQASSENQRMPDFLASLMKRPGGDPGPLSQSRLGSPSMSGFLKSASSSELSLARSLASSSRAKMLRCPSSRATRTGVNPSWS